MFNKHIRFAVFGVSVFTNALIAATIILFYSEDSYAARKVVVTQPINNNAITIQESPENNPNNYRDMVARYLEYVYYRSDGKVNDKFIPYADSALYFQSLPHGTQEMITNNNEQIAQAEAMAVDRRSEEDVIDEYYFMRKRVLAPTMLRT